MDFLKHLIGQPKKCIIHEKLDQQLLLNHIIFICYPYNQYLTRLLYQIMFFSKIHPAENGSTRAIHSDHFEQSGPVFVSDLRLLRLPNHA